MQAKTSQEYTQESGDPVSVPASRYSRRVPAAASHCATRGNSAVLALMTEVSATNFGLLIAYLVPGFTALWGTSYFSETIRHWLSGSGGATPTVGGFMYITLASVAAGVTVSTVRWAIIDTIHRWTGLAQPKWDFSRLQDNVTAYNVLNEIHYKYFLFHSNLNVAIVFLYTARRIHLGLLTEPLGWIDLAFLLLCVILFVGARDNLRKYYERVGQLLGTTWSSDCPRCSANRLAHRRQPSAVVVDEPAGLTSSTIGDLKGDIRASQLRRIPERRIAGR
jgi:hypothetical protein